MSLLQAYLRNPRTQRALSRKPGDKGFSLIELVVVVAVLAVLIVVALPNFQGVTDDAAAGAGKKYLVDATTECAVARTRGKTGEFTPPNINGGVFDKTSKQTCPTTSGSLTLKFTPAADTIPTYTIDTYSGEKTCDKRKANDGEYGCKGSVW